MGLFQPNVLTVKRKAWPIIDDTLEIEGISGVEKEVLLSANANDKDDTIRKRVARIIKVDVKILTDGELKPDDLWFCDQPVVMSEDDPCDMNSEFTKIMCDYCETLTVGTVKNGRCTVTISMLAPVDYI